MVDIPGANETSEGTLPVCFFVFFSLLSPTALTLRSLLESHRILPHVSPSFERSE